MEKYQVKISKRFVALWNVDDDMDINKSLESVTKYMNATTTENVGYYELKQHNP